MTKDTTPNMDCSEKEKEKVKENEKYGLDFYSKPHLPDRSLDGIPITIPNTINLIVHASCIKWSKAR